MSEAFDPTGRLVLIRVVLTGPTGTHLFRFGVDTGATRTAVAAHVLELLGYHEPPPAARRIARTGSGSTRAGMVPVTRIQALGRVRTEFPVLWFPFDPGVMIDGLLGLDFFRGLVLTLDFARGRARRAEALVAVLALNLALAFRARVPHNRLTRRPLPFKVHRMPSLPACPGPRLSRRQMIQAGAASYFGLSLPQLLRAKEARKNTAATADACIVIFLNGGPSHLDMWDPKPDAPAEVRGEFKPIQTSVPGVMFGEHLPKFARRMHRCSLIRSAHHSVNNAHAAAVYCALTGHDRGEIGGGARPDDYPCIGSVVGTQRPPATAVPPHVLMPYITKEGAGGPPQPGFFGGWLGKPRDPLVVLRDPNAADFALPELTLGPDIDPSRFDARKLLSEKLSATRATSSDPDLEGIRAKAYDLLTAPAMREAVRIDREPGKLRDAYGRNIYGQSVLLSRRLIEAGTRVACVSWAPDANATWDTHGNNFTKLKGELLPQLDSAYSALIDDLDARGMLERTLVVVVGDFGRTPKINTNGGGRDHWNFCYSLVLAGGGVKGGYVHGASDKIGAKPGRNPVSPADVIATIYECLGVPHDLELRDRLSRPFTLCPWGNPIREVLA